MSSLLYCSAKIPVISKKKKKKKSKTHVCTKCQSYSLIYFLHHALSKRPVFHRIFNICLWLKKLPKNTKETHDKKNCSNFDKCLHFIVLLWLFVLCYVPPTEGGGHIVFGAVPVGVGVRVGVRVRVASFLRDIF